jgi:hypothetical protein
MDLNKLWCKVILQTSVDPFESKEWHVQYSYLFKELGLGSLNKVHYIILK